MQSRENAVCAITHLPEPCCLRTKGKCTVPEDYQSLLERRIAWSSHFPLLPVVANDAENLLHDDIR